MGKISEWEKMKRQAQDENSVLSPDKKQKFDDWWKKRLDSPLVWITTNFSNWSGPFENDNPGNEWLNPEMRIQTFTEKLKSAIFIGDSFPYHFVNYGPGILAGFLGGEVNFDRETMWIESTIEEYSDFEEEISLERDGRYWKLVEELTDLSLKESKGSFVTSITDIGGIMDVLSGMRGSNRFLKDLVRNPQEVKMALEKIKDAWFETFEYFSEKLLAEQNCMVAWNGIYSEKPAYTPQNDMSCMISTERFRGFSLEHIRDIMEKVDRTVYHLDGPGALKHLDEILSLEELNAVQWVPGAGAPGGANPASPYGKDKGMLHWVEELKKIKEQGKSIEVSVHPEDAVPLIEKLGPANLLLKIRCRSPEEGNRIYEMVKKETH